MKSILKNPKHLALIVAITGIICLFLSIVSGSMSSYAMDEVLTVSIAAIFPSYLLVAYMLLLFFNKLNNVKVWNVVLLVVLILSAIISFVGTFGIAGFVDYTISDFYVLFVSKNSILAISYIHFIIAILYYILTAIVILGIIKKKNLAHKILNYICIILMIVSIILAIVLGIKDCEVIKTIEIINAIIGPIGMIAFSLFLERYSISVIKEK
ncbi:MAG: hypothetical protein IKR57_05560 [Bacilli bacterium]|nr:hypothetical protein [Bacilli bacterium]